MDDTGWLELIENIVFPWVFSDEFLEENVEETYGHLESRDYLINNPLSKWALR